MYSLMLGRNEGVEALAQHWGVVQLTIGKDVCVRTKKHEGLSAIISFVGSRQGPWVFFG